jgi:hypothetical protein
MTTDHDDDLDLDDDDDGVTGEAAVLHWVESLGARFTFVGSVGDALRLAEDCAMPDCMGVHDVAALDERGRLRVTPTGAIDIDELRDRMRQANDQHRQRENARHRAMYRQAAARLGLPAPTGRKPRR